MQILKDEVRDKILESSKIVFKEYGFEKASMREIAKGSKISVGNLYRYYENKEDLFNAVVCDAFEEIEYFIKNNKALSILENVKDYMKFKIQFKILAKIFYKYKIELLILIYGSKGTKFENTKNNIIELVEEKMKVALKSANEPRYKEKEYLTHIISVSLVEGLITIIREQEEDKIIKDSVEQYIRFMFKSFNYRFNR